MIETFLCDRVRWISSGVRPRGAQVRRTSGAINKPLSSRKTRKPPTCRAFFNPRPVALDPRLDQLLLPLDRTPLRLLWAPAHRMEQTRDMPGVVLDAQPFGEQLGDPSARPKIAGESGGPSTREKHRLEPIFVFRRELRRPARNRLCLHGLPPAGPMRCFPPAHAAPVDADPPRHLHRPQPLGEQSQRPLAPPLQLRLAALRSHFAPPARRIGHFLCAGQ